MVYLKYSNYKIMGCYKDFEDWVMVKLEDGRFGVVSLEFNRKWHGCICTYDLLIVSGGLNREIKRSNYERVVKIMEDDTTDFIFWNETPDRSKDDLSLDDMEVVIID